MTAHNTKKTLFFACLGGVCISLAFLGGHIHSTAYVAIVVIAVVFADTAIAGLVQSNKIWQPIMKGGAVIAVAALVTVLVTLPQAIASQEYLRLAYKWHGSGFTSYPHVVPYDEYVSHSLRNEDLLTIVTGGTAAGEAITLFATWTGIACALIALWVCLFWKVSFELRVATLAGGALLALALAMGFAKLPLLGWFFYHIPFVSLLRLPSRATTLYAFAVALLAMSGITLIHLLLQTWTARFARMAIIPRLVIAGLVLFALLEAREVSRKTMVPLYALGSEMSQIHDGQMTQALIALSRSQPPIYRYYAPRELVRPNLPDIYPIFSAHGDRSSRPIAFHSYFDFNPVSSRMDALGVRWWISDRDIPHLDLLATVGNARIYERPSALPIFSLAQPDGTSKGAPISRVHWGVNTVVVHFSEPVKGRLVFAQTRFPGWTARDDRGSLVIDEDQDLLTFNLPKSTRTVKFIYAPWWFVPSLGVSLFTLACIGLLGVLVAKAKVDEGEFLSS